jgi:hypothetical protein
MAHNKRPEPKPGPVRGRTAGSPWIRGPTALTQTRILESLTGGANRAEKLQNVMAVTEARPGDSRAARLIFDIPASYSAAI